MEGALEAAGHGAPIQPQLEGRLRVARAWAYRVTGRPAAAMEDLQTATRILTGADRLEALELIAQVAADEGKTQDAELALALTELEATRIGRADLLGLLLTDRAAALDGLGLVEEADQVLERGTRLLELHGDAHQRFRSYWNAAWIAYLRREGARAEAGFARCAERARLLEGEAWLSAAESLWAWALFITGRFNEGMATHHRSVEVAERTGIPGSLLRASAALCEGLHSIGRHQEALAAADQTLQVALAHWPGSKPAARFLRARSLLRLGRVEEAADESDNALTLLPGGGNGWHWRLRCRSLALAVRAREGRWPRQEAERLTEELASGSRVLECAELLVVRADREGDPALTRQAAELALRAGVPMTAARAVQVGGHWEEPTGRATVRLLRRMAEQLPDRWRSDWAALPEVAPALAPGAAPMKGGAD